MEHGFTMDQALAEASRCLLCHDAPCAAGCPASTAPDVFIRKLRFRNIKGAAKVIKERNIMGGACAVVCPTHTLCAKGCTAAGLDKPIRIGELQRFIVEHAWRIGFNPLVAGEANGIQVAIVGAGPAGLACAADLAKAGFGAVVFEKRSAAGGMLQWGIPNHRMSREFFEHELEDIRSLGVEFRFNTPIQTQADVDKLRADGFAAVFVATGAWRCITLDVEHRDGTGLEDSMSFLLRAKDQPDVVRKELTGAEVLVVGGGDTAMDAAVSAKRAGARDVSIVYRRSFQEMPGSPGEKQDALDAGVHFVILTQPVDYVISDGKITGARVVRTRLTTPDDSGRRRPENLPDTEHILAADLIIEAIGLTPDPSVRQLDALTIGDGERIVVDEAQRASADLPLYAGGDAVSGASIVVKAVRDGKAAAAAIRKELGQ
jgi:NADPH-dependent glutamate synthase beta subunit-like oxidoreductase